ncbi:MAG: hypothetical protein U0694_07585 [Anaerolineae bacterium]
MNGNVLLGVSRYLLPIPRFLWQQQVQQNAAQMAASLSFMSPEHHAVRNFVVREIPKVGKPLPPEYIAASLSLPLTQVVSILEELERHMTFLFRNEHGAVAWAYPVTADKTPHRVTLQTGEVVYAA